MIQFTSFPSLKLSISFLLYLELNPASLSWGPVWSGAPTYLWMHAVSLPSHTCSYYLISTPGPLHLLLPLPESSPPTLAHCGWPLLIWPSGRFTFIERLCKVALHQAWGLPVLSHHLFCFLWCVHHLKVSPFFFFPFYFWLCWVFAAARGPIAESRLLSSCGAQAALCAGFSGLWSPGSRVQGLLESWLTGLAAPRHVESFQTRDWTHVPCTGRQIPKHWTTKEVLFLFLIFVSIISVAYLEN